MQIKQEILNLPQYLEVLWASFDKRKQNEKRNIQKTVVRRGETKAKKTRSKGQK